MLFCITLTATAQQEAITHEGKTTIINTTTLCNAKGYNGSTPVKIFIEDNKVVKIETLRNRETPRYFAQAKKLLEKFVGKSVKKASKMNVDAVTGATFTSESLKKNVKAGLEAYKKR